MNGYHKRSLKFAIFMIVLLAVIVALADLLSTVAPEDVPKERSNTTTWGKHADQRQHDAPSVGA